MSEDVEHGKPPDQNECMVCFGDIDNENYVEYQTDDNSKWFAALSCQMCIEYLIETQFNRYSELVKTTTCKAELGRLLKSGPPINLREPTTLPCPDDKEVHKLWYMSDNKERSAKLVGSLEGEERQKYWDEIKEFWSQEDEATKESDD